MLPQNDPRSDSRLLLAVAGVVVAGAVAVVLVAGWTAQRDRPGSATVTHRSAGPAATRTDVLPASLEVVSESPEVLESTLSSEPRASTIESVAVDVEIDPGADPWRAGSRAYHEGDYARAAAYFRADAGRRPGRAYTHYMLGLALWKSGELTGALEAMERSAAINGRSTRTFVNLSRIHSARGEYEAAKSAAEGALALDAENPAALYQLARSQYNLGRVEEATATLESCIALDPAAAEAYNLLGLVRLRGGDDSEALGSLESAAALKPDVAYIQNNLGLALERSGRLEEAEIAFRRAVEIDGSHAAAAVSLARVEARRPHEAFGEREALELAEASTSDPSSD